ncbi:MAG: S-adenosylmethionine decarboxylase [Flavobacteriales bacterium]|nr:S-adenosylmethionine decarboxylase [Flavobacteriales bacterium]
MGTPSGSPKFTAVVSGPYRPGKHIVVDGNGLEETGLVEVMRFQSMIEPRIEALGLVSVGAVYHDFPGGGYTAVICLTESHVSIHTWPEHGRATFDVFLSNFSKDNDAAGNELVRCIQAYLGDGAYDRTDLRR